MTRNTIIQHNALATPWPLADNSVDVIVTSPPYWGLRDYKHEDQIGMEETPEEFIEKLVRVFREAWRVLKPQGTLWVNIADTYWGGKGQSGGTWDDSGYNKGRRGTQKGETRPQDRRHATIKPKDLVGIPWMLAFALRADGWYLRQDNIWNKPNPMPESVTDRCTKAHEYVFMLTKNRYYYFDQQAILQPIQLSSSQRLAQDLEGQVGSDRVPGKTNGAMKATRRSGNLQRKSAEDRGVPEDGKGNQQSHVPWEGDTANKKSVWTVTTTGFDGEFCTACHRYYVGKDKRLIRTEWIEREGKKEKQATCLCGRHDAWVAHFATFPERLIKDCILASTSQHGNCKRCGEPYERVLQEDDPVGHDGQSNTKYDEKSTAGRLAKLRQAARDRGEEYSSRKKTKGWKKTCNCESSDREKPIVLDPFMGAGTTAITALAHGRDFIGLELNPHYVALATARIRHQFGIFFQT